MYYQSKYFPWVLNNLCLQPTLIMLEINPGNMFSKACFLFTHTTSYEVIYIIFYISPWFFLKIEACISLLTQVCNLPSWAMSLLCVYLNRHSHLMLQNTHFQKLYMNFSWERTSPLELGYTINWRDSKKGKCTWIAEYISSCFHKFQSQKL